MTASKPTLALVVLVTSLVGCPDPAVDDGADEAEATGSDSTTDPSSTTDEGDSSDTSVDTSSSDSDSGSESGDPPPPDFCNLDCGVGCPLRVDDDVAFGGDGTTWADALSTVQAAIDCSVAGQQIWIAGGNYPGIDRDPVAVTPHPLEIYGGFAGTEDSLAERVLGVHETNLGPAQTSIVIVQNDLILDGVSVRGGNAARGGGLHITGNWAWLDGLVHVRHAIFEDNNASEFGGAIAQSFSEPVLIEDTTFTNNFADTLGSAIWANDGSILVHDSVLDGHAGTSVIANNVAGYSSIHVEGSIVANNPGTGAYGQSISVVDSHFEANLDHAIHSVDSTSVSGSVFIGNASADAGIEDGGGAILGGGDLFEGFTHVSDSVFIGNQAIRGGAILANELEVQRSRFIANTADEYGGGVSTDAFFAPCVIEDSEFVDNVAGEAGGGVYGSPLIRRSTFAGNLAGGQPNGLADMKSVYDPSVESSVFWPDSITQIPNPNLPPEDFIPIAVTSSCVGLFDAQLVDVSADSLLLAASPFAAADLDDDGLIEFYLASNSACVDLVADPGAGAIDWEAMTTQLSQCTDLSPLDAGMHYTPSAAVGPCPP